MAELKRWPKMKHIISIFIFIVIGVLAASAAEKWEASELIGYSLTIVSRTTVQDFRFTERGDALAEFGSKGGAVCGPIVHWKIDSDGILRIVWDGKEAVVLKKIKVTGSRYLVEEGGVHREYIRADWTEYQESHPKKKI